MQRRQPVYIGVVDICSLSQELRHLLPVSGGAGGHKHSALGEAHSGPSVSGSGGLAPRLRSGPIRLRALPPLQLILPPLLRRFGPGTVSGRHLPPSVSPGEFLFIRQVMSDSRTSRSSEPILSNDSFEPIRGCESIEEESLRRFATAQALLNDKTFQYSILSVSYRFFFISQLQAFQKKKKKVVLVFVFFLSPHSIAI